MNWGSIRERKSQQRYRERPGSRRGGGRRGSAAGAGAGSWAAPGRCRSVRRLPGAWSRRPPPRSSCCAPNSSGSTLSLLSRRPEHAVWSGSLTTSDNATLWTGTGGIKLGQEEGRRPPRQLSSWPMCMPCTPRGRSAGRCPPGSGPSAPS